MVPGETKAWAIRLHGANSMWCDDADGIMSDLEASTEDTPEAITPDLRQRLLDMSEGDEIEVGEFTVTCHMVDKSWLDSLPEHSGW